MLAEAGYRLRSNPRQLVVEDRDNDVELFYLRPLDIAVYVGRGTIDVGITGEDLLKNSGTEAVEHLPLGFGSSTFRFAAPNESSITELKDSSMASVSGPRSTSWFMTIWSSRGSMLKPSTWMVLWNHPCSLALQI